MNSCYFASIMIFWTIIHLTIILNKSSNYFLSYCRNILYNKMLILLSQCDFNIGKTLQMHEMNQREMKNYRKLYEEIGMMHALSLRLMRGHRG